jgi:hypothetical protein
MATTRGGTSTLAASRMVLREAQCKQLSFLKLAAVLILLSLAVVDVSFIFLVAVHSRWHARLHAGTVSTLL